MSERLSALGTARMNYRPRRRREAFRSLSSARMVGDLMLSANSCSEVEYTGSNINQCILIIPLVGEGVTRQDKREIGWNAATAGAIVPRMDTFGFSTRRSVAGVSLDETHLENLARHMLGYDASRSVLDFEVLRTLPYRQGSIRFDILFRRLISAIDECMSEPAILDHSGLDDAFNRLIVMWLRPEAFIASQSKAFSQHAGIDDACDYILANLDRKITLTDLEKISGLSPRVLQYKFQDRFGSSPMQWVLDRRLEAVRAQLLEAPPGTSVSTIAFQYFGNLGDFTMKYKKKFGETPSRTIGSRKK